MVNTFTITQTPSATDIFVYPNADLAGCTEHTPVGDLPNFANVDELKDESDDDTTYNYNDLDYTYIDLFNVPNQTLTGTINYVQVYARAKTHEYPQSADSIYKIAISPTAVCTDIYLSADIDLITSYSLFNNVWRDNPATSVDWTWANINALTIGYQSNSSDITLNKIDTFRPNAAGTYCGLAGQGCPNCIPSHWECVDEEEYDDDTYASTINLETGCPGADGTWATDTFHMPNHTTQTGTISRIVIVARMSYTGNCPDNGWIVAVPSDGTTNEYATPDLTHRINEGWGMYTQEFLVHPTSGLPWTWTDIDGLEIGYKLQTKCNASNEVCFRAYCTQVYLLVYYAEPDNPEIRTTQCYAKVNYTPPTDSCYLNKPNQISTNHSRNIKMINFWSGNREVYDLNRSGKSMVLTGTEFHHPECTDVCARIECVRQMALNGTKVTIDELGSILWDGTYYIRSFGWKHKSECLDWFEWMLELEDVRHAEVGDGYDG